MPGSVAKWFFNFLHQTHGVLTFSFFSGNNSRLRLYIKKKKAKHTSRMQTGHLPYWKTKSKRSDRLVSQLVLSFFSFFFFPQSEGAEVFSLQRHFQNKWVRSAASLIPSTIWRAGVCDGASKAWYLLIEDLARESAGQKYWSSWQVRKHTFWGPQKTWFCFTKTNKEAGGRLKYSRYQSRTVCVQF